jgi:pSer/pThr/pTyr-binding forkhead associated (FHA) protein
VTASDATLHGISPADASAPALELAVIDGSDTTRTIPCRRVVTLIGSREGCKVQLNHSLVAPVHIAIVNDGTDIYAVDLVTRRGTTLNGAKLEHELLKDGDVLRIDPFEFRVGIRRSEPGSNGQADGVDLDPAPQLIALEHVESGRVLQPHRKVCVIGRRSGCDIRVEDAEVSRAHAILFVYKNRPVVCDLLSSNGTFVNDTPIVFQTMKDQDVLRIGEAMFRVRVIDAGAGQKKSKDAIDITPPRGKAPNGSSPGAPAPVRRPAVELEDDLIDIEAVDRAQNWRIADALEKVPGKK